MNTNESRERGSAWSTAAVITGIVAAGIVVAGLLNDPVPDDIAIPGCDEVIQPEDTERVNYAIAGEGSFGGPAAEWLTAQKASAMTAELARLLPAGAVVEPDPNFPPLQFDPPVIGRPGDPSYGETTAVGTVVLGGTESMLVVRVGRSDESIGPCFAGSVDERRTLDDGTVVDISDGKAHRVRAYAADGTRVDVSGQGVFTMDQVLKIATSQGLRATEPVPE